jgi:hypothetical protein
VELRRVQLLFEELAAEFLPLALGVLLPDAGFE